MARRHTKVDATKAREFAIEAARILADRKCTDVLVLDVRGQSQVSDFLVIGSGTSHRQMRSVAQELKELGKSLSFPAIHTSRDDGATWICADFVEVVAHLFEPEQRLYYDLELLWADAPRVDWRRETKPGTGSGSGARAPAASPARTRAES